MDQPSTFDLSKWYADCVNDEGDVSIIYFAELRWRALVIHYASVLEHRNGNGTRTRFSLRRCRPPSVRGDLIEWRSPSLEVEGTWKALGQPLQEMILESDAGTIEWHCLQPRASTEVRIGDAGAICGLGYVEHLKLSVPPWQIPFKELHWGRFLDETDVLVWIDLRGPESKQVVFHNGAAVSAERITDHEVVLAGTGTALSFENRCVLREGALGTTALSSIPRAHKIFPGRILSVRECKWRSRGVLRRPGAPDGVGWAIHEVVEWP